MEKSRGPAAIASWIRLTITCNWIGPLRRDTLAWLICTCPGGGLFSISGFRLFGNGLGATPEVVTRVEAVRNVSDSRQMHVSWKDSKRADFYIIRYGVRPDGLWNNYQVYNATQFDINSLNVGVGYYFTVDAVNDSGDTLGTEVVSAK